MISMIAFSELVLSVILILLSFEIWYRKRPKHYPPGPLPLPILGNMINFLPNPLKSLPNLHDKYGKILALDLGYYRTVLINDVSLIRELYQTEASNGAPLLLGLELDRSPSGKPLGVISLDGEQHTEVLRLLRKSAKEITESIPEIDDILQESTNFLIESFDTAAREWITGERADPKDPVVSKIIEITLGFFKSIGSGHPSFFFPWVCKIAPGLSGWRHADKGNRQVVKHIEKSIENRNNSFSVREERIGNVMDAFNEAIKKTTDPKTPLYKDLGYLNARGTYVTLLYGGTETTSATLCWALLYMLKTHGAQEKLQREIDEIIGSVRSPSVSDRYRMPYTTSFLNETLRIAPAGPLGVPRRLIQDINFHGYILRKDTIILPNIYGCHHDKTIWGVDADEFRPERFLNESGNKLMISNLFNFGSGKRSCPGEPIARLQVFFVFVALLQLFNFHVDDADCIRTEGNLAKQSMTPFPFSFKVKRRMNTHVD